MESNHIDILGLTLFFLLFLHGASGRVLQRLAKEMNENGSILYEESPIKPILPTTVFTQTAGYNNNDTLISQVLPYAIDANRVYHYAMYNSKDGMYHGVHALIEVYAYFPVQAHQLSSSLIWVVNGFGNNFNSIQAGWHIYPEWYGDNETHFFIYWTADGYKNTGCYNIKCFGFVTDTSAVIKPGDIMRSANVGLKILRDQQTGDWRLYAYGSPVGYWPVSLFSALANGAAHIALGGMVSFINNDKSPPMGNGFFPNSDGKQAAVVKSIEFVDEKGGDQYPNADDFSPYQDKDSCYKVDAISDSDTHNGYFFSYGGPGGCTG